MKREEAIEINRENMHMLYVCMLTRIPKMLGRVGKTKNVGKNKRLSNHVSQYLM